MRDHGGNLDEAMARHGGTAADWIDLSTGINRLPYPVPDVAMAAWRGLPTADSLARLTQTARAAYRAPGGAILAIAGAQASIQLIPRLGPPGRAAILAPTYNEHAAALRAAGWEVQEVSTLAELAGSGLAVVVNPNNPDGRRWPRMDLLDLCGSVGRLIVDESFVDPEPELSVCPQAGRPGLLVLRSFGKFYGLAGVRLGFVLGSTADVAALAELAGPWPVSGPAITVGCAALADAAWAAATADRLNRDAHRLDRLALQAGWLPVGGTRLFRLYEVGDAQAAQVRLARRHIWSRAFPYAPTWLRLGLPGADVEWQRLEAALAR
ncbi:MAG: threonine-phosphate decarboxylase CobD [Hyphomicrobiaceae bacterium]|nr:threonine-phosphate decarboxylase CobD [Hyphomicrobiaceae bacterium]